MEGETIEFEMIFMWVPTELGGHSGRPWEGMRFPMYLWSDDRNGEATPTMQCTRLSESETPGIWSGNFVISKESSDHLEKNAEHVIMSDGSKIIGIGKII